MYKKYIKKGDKKLGPYYYESVREKTGKIKTVYLGTDPDSLKFKEKLAKLKSNVALPVEAAVRKGETVIIPIEADSIERPKRLEKKPDDLLNLNKLFSKCSAILGNIKKSSANVLDAPYPGKADFNFENFLFALIGILFVFGFFFLQDGLSSATGEAIVDSATKPVPSLYYNCILEDNDNSASYVEGFDWSYLDWFMRVKK